MKKISEERRKFNRFKARKGTYVTIRGKYYKLGQLIDISKGGISFLYIANGEEMSGRFNVDLLSLKNTLCLRNMQFKTISDFNQDNESPLIHGEIRRCGGQFEKLIQSQEIQLDYFIKSNTTE